ncbi:MAG: MASE3 domain-containing protein [Desulfobacterales bacterium]|nr:MASE3 domain-containing protein [Desulfobacterales bacterium]
MHDTAARMREVLQSLLNYSRLTFQPASLGRVDLNRIVGEVVSDFDLQIRDTETSVEIGNLPEIDADAAQMSRLFQNLLGNALKFRKVGERTVVKILAESRTPGGYGNGQCTIYVKDNGIGFDEKYLPKIFVPFQRLHAKHEYEGAGMGLAICSKIVEFQASRAVPGRYQIGSRKIKMAGSESMPFCLNLFHAVVDGVSIVIAAGVFMIVWNVRRNLDNDYLLYIGISFLFFAFLDSMHFLGNKNMGVFPDHGNLGPAFYIHRHAACEPRQGPVIIVPTPERGR